MERVGIYEAKARLSDLVERAARGTEVMITRHGKAIAKLVPARSHGTPDRKKVFDDIAAFAKTVRTRRFDLRRVIETGRR